MASLCEGDKEGAVPDSCFQKGKMELFRIHWVSPLITER